MKKYLLALGLFLLVTGCVPQKEVKPQTGYVDKETYANWQTLDAGDFTIQAPSGWIFTPEMGIDSTIGKFSGDGVTLIFDYGMYSGDFSNNSVYFEDPSAYMITEEIIDELPAKIYVPNDSSVAKPTVLFIEDTNGPISSQENFEMLGDDLNQEQIALAVQIFRTVNFK